MDEVITAEGVAEMLFCTADHVEQLAREGELPAVKIGRKWIFVKSDLIAYLAERGREEAAERRRTRTGSVDLPMPVKSRRRAPPPLPVPSR